MIARHNGNPYISSTKRAINEQQEIGPDSNSRSFCHAKLSLHNPLGHGDSPLSGLGTERVWRVGQRYRRWLDIHFHESSVTYVYCSTPHVTGFSDTK
ncbi:hypothetical protein ACSS6W_001921 [Trichoderma asperelloides]